MTLHEHDSPVVPVPSLWNWPVSSSLNPRRVGLPKGALLRAGKEIPTYAHILESGIVSGSVQFDNGRTMTVRILGPGDLLEMDQLLGCSTRHVTNKVLVPGVAVRIAFEGVREALARDRAFQESFWKTLGTRTLELEQLSVCNGVHPLEQRLARHLLLLSEKSGEPRLSMTQEELAQHLGVQRSSVVGAAGVLREKGLITFSRGMIAITNVSLLQNTACECYRMLRRFQSRAPIKSTDALMEAEKLVA